MINLTPDREDIKTIARERLRKEEELGILTSEEDMNTLILGNRVYYRISCAKYMFRKVMKSKIIHKCYMDFARKRGFDVSEFPEELNYLEMRN